MTIFCGSRNVQRWIDILSFPWSQRIPFGRRMTRNCSRQQHQPFFLYVLVGRREERSKLVRAQYAFLFVHTCD